VPITRIKRLAVIAAVLAGVVGATASPAEAATANTVTRFGETPGVSISGPFTCHIEAAFNTSSSVGRGQQARHLQVTYTCPNGTNGRKIQVQYFIRHEWFADGHNQAFHELDLAYSPSFGSIFTCGKVGSRGSGLGGTVSSTFSRRPNPGQWLQINTVAKCGGQNITLAFGVNEGWSAT
jgi:hypothetical protein